MYENVYIGRFKIMGSVTDLRYQLLLNLFNVYTRMDAIPFYYSLCIMFNIEMSNTSNR